MATVLTQSHLDANLASLGARNADLAQKLRTTQPHPGILFAVAPDGVPVATLEGKQLCSRHQPLDEAIRQVNDVDLVEHAAVMVIGFGLGYHVQKLAGRTAKATLVIIFESDLPLLRSVFEHIDHSSWMNDALLLFISDPDDRSCLAEKLNGAESILAQGVHFLEHPASRTRLRETSSVFVALFTELVSAAKTTLLTTLMRSVDTTRNLMLNLDHYAGGSGIVQLRDIATGHPAVIVSAGPSLQKNLHLLAQPGVRDRCVIIAVQTTLKPLLAAGIKPHFVTALDYHEISKRFYENIDADDLREITLIADPKAHPVILDSFPGPIRCCSNGFVDRLLGSLRREMGDLPAGATVAHLALYVAKYLGCNPIAFIGQDLGFTDGLYYAPTRGIAIHDVWAPELNTFNTIEMMEWQRIVRHRLHLRKMKDVDGKSIYTDAQMHTYLQQFERDFGQCHREGLTIVDATEGGVAKQHTTATSLAAYLDEHVAGSTCLPSIPLSCRTVDRARLASVRKRLAEVRGEVHQLRSISIETASVLRNMIEDQSDSSKMVSHFRKVDQNRQEVEKRLNSFELLNHLNQVGVFNRMKADRRLHMQNDLNPHARQKAQLERDLTNVLWSADAAQELIDQLELAQRLLSNSSASKTRPSQIQDKAADRQNTAESTITATSHIAALIPINPDCNGLLLPRSLAEPFQCLTTLQATLMRLGQSRTIGKIILIAPIGFDLASLFDPAAIELPVEIERVDGSPFGPEQKAIAAARLFAETCWRGGIAGMSVYDEVLCPRAMHAVMERRGLTAALIVAPDWPLLQVTEPGGCDDVVKRHLQHPAEHNLVFSQAPPGLCGCVVSAKLMAELSQRNRLSTIGGLLTYQPHAPQGDPIARECCVQIEPTVRQSLIRATFDSQRQHQRLGPIQSGPPTSAAQIVALLENTVDSSKVPRHLVLELCTDRISEGGRFKRHSFGPITRPPLTLELAQRVFASFSMTQQVVVSFSGYGDSLLHPHFAEIVKLARSFSRAIHVRTDLLATTATLDHLLACGVDVVSVNLNADRAATYKAMMGLDRFKDVLMNIDYLLEHRQKLTTHAGTAAFALPWVLPHLQRCIETYEDIDSFYDRWQRMLGCAVIEGLPPFDVDAQLAAAFTPQKLIERRQQECMTVYSDGRVPFDEWDWACHESAGDLHEASLADVWDNVRNRTRKQ